MKKITKIEPAAAVQKTKKLRVAAYCRVSTGMDDQLISLETQKAHYEDYISSNPEWEYAGLYYDEGITGTKKEKRPALMQMMQDCEDGKIDYIVTKSLSRFARNTTDCLELVRKLLGLGISIYFEKEELDTGAMDSEFLLSVMSSLAQSESLSISENSKWGIRRRFENGTYKIGYAPYGYSVKDGEFSINETEAAWVRFIFAEAAAGKSSHQIAKELNGKQIPTRRGGAWYSTTVRGILRNEKYTGDCLFQKTYSDFRFRRHANRGERDQFYMEGHHEAIISRETFEAAGQMLLQRAVEKNVKAGDAKYQKRYPFSGKVICGSCGAPFKRRTHSTGSVKYPAWVCRKHIEDKEGCTMKFVRESALEAAFATMMNKLVFGREEILQELLEKIRSSAFRDILIRLNAVDAELEGMAERRQNLTAIMAKGYIDPAACAQETGSLFAEAAALEDERERLAREAGGDMKKTEALRELLAFTGKGRMLTEFDAGLFGQFVDHVTVCSREEAQFHLKCGLCLRERIG